MNDTSPTRRRQLVSRTLATVAGVVMVGAVAFGVPLMLRETLASSVAIPSPPTLDTMNCPTAWPQPGIGSSDRPGPLVPADGAVAVTLCELPAASLAAPPAAAAAVPRILKLRPGELVAAMNALPTPAHLDDSCALIAFPENLSLVVSYADRDPFAVLLDRNCQTATSDGRTRRITGTDIAHPALLDTFLALYREQLVAMTDPATVKAPACAASLTQQDVSGLNRAVEPRDGIARNRGGADGLAPSALVDINVCRYRTGAGGLRLATQHAQRQDLEAFRDLLNSAAMVRSTTDATGVQSLTNASGCQRGTNIDELDVIWLADATGAVTEVRLPRAPCPEVQSAGMTGLVAPPQLLGQLDLWLA